MMKKYLLIASTLIMFVYNINANTLPSDYWFNKFNANKTFTYGEYKSMSNVENKEIDQRFFAAGYYAGLINGTAALNAINHHYGYQTIYCIPMNKRLTSDDYNTFMRIYYMSLNEEQKKEVDDIPLEIIHIQALKLAFPCKE